MAVFTTLHRVAIRAMAAVLSMDISSCIKWSMVVLFITLSVHNGDMKIFIIVFKNILMPLNVSK